MLLLATGLPWGQAKERRIRYTLKQSRESIYSERRLTSTYSPSSQVVKDKIQGKAVILASLGRIAGSLRTMSGCLIVINELERPCLVRFAQLTALVGQLSAASNPPFLHAQSRSPTPLPSEPRQPTPPAWESTTRSLTVYTTDAIGWAATEINAAGGSAAPPRLAHGELECFR